MSKNLAVVLVILSATASAAATTELVNMLKTHSVSGYRVYTTLKDKSIFDFFSKTTTNGGRIGAISTAVHESLHKVDSELTDAARKTGDIRNNFVFFLVDGSQASISSTPPDEKGGQTELEPSSIAHAEAEKLGSDIISAYAKTYLAGEMGKQKFDSILDELNAYAHDARVVSDLAAGLRETRRINPGLQIMIIFCGLYIERVKADFPATWRAVKNGADFQKGLKLLYSQALDELRAACTSKYSGTEKEVLRLALGKRITGAWEAALGTGATAHAAAAARTCGILQVKPDTVIR